MKDILCILMGCLDILAGILLISMTSNSFFMIIGILLAVKGGMSFL